MTHCNECGSTDLSWDTTNIVLGGVAQGRLKTEEVRCVFFLGCNECSATVDYLKADDVAKRMNVERTDSMGRFS